VSTGTQTPKSNDRPSITSVISSGDTCTHQRRRLQGFCSATTRCLLSQVITGCWSRHLMASSRGPPCKSRSTRFPFPLSSFSDNRTEGYNLVFNSPQPDTCDPKDQSEGTHECPGFSTTHEQMAAHEPAIRRRYPFIISDVARRLFPFHRDS
jgi:hypothetical protein